MSKKEQSLEKIEEILKITPDHRKKIAQVVADNPDRFLDARDFVEKALDIFLTWEKEPFETMNKIAEMEPTMKQFQMMKITMNPEQLKKIHPEFPEKWGSKWTEFEKANPVKMPENSTSQKQQDARQSEKDFEKIQEKMLEANNFLRETKFNEITDKELEQIVYDGWPLISTNYSRLFPAKIAVVTLAEMVREQKSPLVDFEEFKIKAYDIAEEISSKLIQYETKNDKKRSEKKSTGLPKPYLLEKITSEQAIKEQRYKDRYFGKITKSKELETIHLDGLLSALGLVKVFSKNKDTKITLTEMGKKFCLFENPVFKGKIDESLSKDESEFLSTKCIPQRPLEHEIVKNVIKLVSETSHGKTPDMACDLDRDCLESINEFLKSKHIGKFEEKIKREVIGKSNEIAKSNKEIDKRIANAGEIKDDVKALKNMKKQTPIEAIRIATMGRMSELGIVNWKINESGRSEYTIADQKLADSI